MYRSRTSLDPCSTSLARASRVLLLLTARGASGATSITDEPDLAVFAATERGSAIVSARLATAGKEYRMGPRFAVSRPVSV